VIERGQVIALGTPGELKDRAGADRVEVTLADPADLATARRLLSPLAIDGMQADQSARRLTVPVAKGAVSLAEALNRLAAGGIAVRDMGLRRPTLDDVFLSLTGHEAQPAGPSGAVAVKEHSR
jgi:ABC-2 type transport system ATP-binding protein